MNFTSGGRAPHAGGWLRFFSATNAARLLAAVACLAGIGIEAGQARTAEPPQTLRVCAVQLRSTRNISENVRATVGWIEQAAVRGAQVAVFPECSVTGYFEPEYMRAFTAEQLAAAEAEIAAACQRHKIHAVVGLPTRQGDRLYNSAVVFDSAGKTRHRYHKIQLAESWPVGGEELAVFRIDGVPCSIIICHDERYPELVRLPVLAGARVVFYLSHESPLTEERKLEPYRAQIQARAVENSVFVVHANAPANRDASGSHGQSRLIAPDGNLLEEAGIFEERALFATLELRLASGQMAQRSVSRGPLRGWWEAGVKQVRQVE